MLDYFSHRTPAVRREIRERIAKLYPDTTEIISRADAILRREFTLWDVTKTLPREIDWYKNPTRDKVWLFALNEFEWLWDVVAAYVLTGDEKYARDFEEIMENFLDRVPTIPWKNERDPVWRLIGAGLRMSGSWVDAFYVFLPSRTVKPETKLRMLSAIYYHAQFLEHFRSPSLNHLIQESYGLLKVGAMFPEFRMASTWVEIAVKRLDWDVTVDVYPDGGYTEASTFYHRYVIRLLQTILEFSEGHNVTLTQNFYRQLEKMYDFLLYTARPDGRMPQVNDGFHAKVLRKLFRRPAAQFQRQDYVYFATDGKQGTAPDKISAAFPYTGLYVMRSDWSHGARYLLFDGGLFGSAHGHEDKLSFELFAYGRPFILEAGTYTYVYNKWHKYFESSFAHNTVVVDGKSQLRFFDKKRWVTQPHRPLPNTWISNDDIDFIESRYDRGYGNVKEKIDGSVSHTRRLLFVKPDYWVLWDVLKGKGKHRYEQLFHFAPLRLRVLENKAVVTKNQGAANLLLYPLFTHGLAVRQEIGAENPIQGWISPKYGEKEPAPAVVYSKKGPVPETFADLLFPLRPGESPENISVTALPLFQDGEALPETEGLAIKVTTPRGEDYIMIAPGHRGRKTFAGFVSTGEVLVVRTTRDGKVEKRSETNL
ncbi:MAG: hypothetical protein D6743_15085 [Calditrichaeota bacterium]|nr:MAG: hypothetical protein D6743_15085 [Calditrichota bacterium]